MAQGYEILVNTQIPKVDLNLQLRRVVRCCHVLANGLERQILQDIHQPCGTKD